VETAKPIVRIDSRPFAQRSLTSYKARDKSPKNYTNVPGKKFPAREKYFLAGIIGKARKIDKIKITSRHLLRKPANPGINPEICSIP
jgi:hypothetical protein